MSGNDAGETSLSEWRLPLIERNPEGTVVGTALRDIPTLKAAVTEMTQKRETQDLCPAPQRQFVIVLRGEFEITTTLGDVQRFGPGDCLLADDLNTRGHTFKDTSADGLICITVGFDPEWKCP